MAVVFSLYLAISLTFFVQLQDDGAYFRTTQTSKVRHGRARSAPDSAICSADDGSITEPQYGSSRWCDRSMHYTNTSQSETTEAWV